MTVVALSPEDHRESFIRENPSQLVSLASYDRYLTDRPENVPTSTQKSHSPFVNQHMYFTEPSYFNVRDEQGLIDSRYRRLRTLTWSQIVMRRSQEMRLHREMEPTIEPPPESTVEAILKDYFDIDLVGAASLGISEAKQSPLLGAYLDKRIVPSEVQLLSRSDKIDIFREERDSALNRLTSPRVAPDILVVSALKRLAARLRSLTLERIAEEMRQEELYYPLRVPHRGTLQNLANIILVHGVGLQDLDKSRPAFQRLYELPNPEAVQS